MDESRDKGLPMQTERSTSAQWGTVPDNSQIVTTDDTPVDIFTQRQARLLTSTLFSSWSGPPREEENTPRTFQVFANVGLFVSARAKPIVPDVMLSLDITMPQPPALLTQFAYFVWEFGKLPELAIEVVADLEGGELTHKMRQFRKLGVKYYVVFDPDRLLSAIPLRSFELRGDSYAELERHLYDPLGLGLVEWHGTHEFRTTTWLRWCTNDGQLIPTAEENTIEARKRADEVQQLVDEERKRADEAQLRVDEERKRATEAQQRAEQLEARLRALGIDPTSI